MPAMTASANAAAGTGAPGAVVQPLSRDDSALISIGTGSPTATGTFATITLSGNYSNFATAAGTPSAISDPAIPKFVVSFTYPSAQAAANGLFVSSVTSRTITIGTVSGTPIANLAAASGYGIVIHGDY